MMKTANYFFWIICFIIMAILFQGMHNKQCSKNAFAAESLMEEPQNKIVSDDGPPVIKIPPEEFANLIKPHPSLIQILAHPDEFHGKEVLVAGFLHIEREGTAIYLSEKDDEYLMACNAFSVSFENNAMHKSREELEKEYSGKYVELRGTFDKNSHGFWGMFQGTFHNISEIDLLKTRSEIRQFLKNMRNSST